jgi:hypothetical protein
MLIIVSLIVNVIITTFIALWSQRVQLNFWTVWLISFFLSPIVAMFYVLINKKEQVEVRRFGFEPTNYKASVGEVAMYWLIVIAVFALYFYISINN